MPLFAAIPPVTGKVRVMGANTYGGVGSVSSATFEVVQPLPVMLAWYTASLKNRGWKLTERQHGHSAHIYAKLPGQPYNIDIQLLALKSESYRTRVFAKEVSYQNVVCPTVGGGATISEDQVSPLGMNGG